MVATHDNIAAVKKLEAPYKETLIQLANTELKDWPDDLLGSEDIIIRSTECNFIPGKILKLKELSDENPVRKRETTLRKPWILQTAQTELASATSQNTAMVSLNLNFNPPP
ncbi:hypothetical protein BYT27DRAFT_7206252 [Phlegmacium glaucopus]|nr:hypothetical protein BYT27DRAFT_7206252 [Phlegmacium glaucopus]